MPNPGKGKSSSWRRKALPMALHEPAACVSSVMWERRKRKKKKPLQSSRLWLLFGAKYSLGFLLRPYFFAWEWNNDLCKISVALEMKQIIFLNLEMAKRPFYSCLFSCLAFEWKWRWRWPCFDRSKLSFKGQATKHNCKMAYYGCLRENHCFWVELTSYVYKHYESRQSK